MSEPIAYRLDLDTAEEFYRRCAARGAETREARMVILKELVYEMRALKLTQQDLKMLTKGKKILHIKGDKNV